MYQKGKEVGIVRLMWVWDYLRLLFGIEIAQHSGQSVDPFYGFWN